jgi:hypothetical protein
MRTAVLILVAASALAGCQNQPAPPTPQRVAIQSPIETTQSERAKQQTHLERMVAYRKENPWAENTGTARLRGSILWGDDGQSPAPIPRRRLVLKGVKGTPTEGIYYRIRASEEGEYLFDRIRGGEFKLSDDTAAGFHWRLRISIADREDRALDLTPANSINVRDDFPEDGT